MVKLGDKPTFQYLNKNRYVKVLSTYSQFSQTEYSFYQKRLGDRLIELVIKNGLVDSKYIYEILGNQIIKELKKYN